MEPEDRRETAGNWVWSGISEKRQTMADDESSLSKNRPKHVAEADIQARNDLRSVGESVGGEGEAESRRVAAVVCWWPLMTEVRVSRS